MNRNKVSDSIDLGLDFLVKSLGSDGFWRTFQSSQGESDVWVTSYILREVGDLFKDEMVVSLICKSLLQEQSLEGGWGYKQKYIADVDSTATVSLALHQFEDKFFPIDIREKAIHYLIDHLDSDNKGFCTFNYESLKKVPLLNNPDKKQVNGWIKPHVDVTLNVCEAVAQIGNEKEGAICTEIFKNLKNEIGNRDFFEAYWWCTDFICTYYLMRSKQVLKLERIFDVGVAQIRAIADEMCTNGFWLSTFSKEPCVFTTSFALRCLSFQSDKYVDEIAKGVDFLLELQNDDGSWNSQPILVIPPPFTSSKNNINDWKIDLPGFPNVLSDINKVFVSAVVIRTLNDILRSDI